MALLRYENAAGRAQAETLAEPVRAETALRYLVDAHLGEPLLVIRGRDLFAIPAMTAYLGLTAGLLLKGPVSDGILADIAAFQTWQARNRDVLKYPDR